jgi:hypothetical protein
MCQIFKSLEFYLGHPGKEDVRLKIKTIYAENINLFTITKNINLFTITKNKNLFEVIKNKTCLRL